MANGVNKVILLGNLGKDPEVKHFEGGSVKVNFPLATSESHKDKNGNRVDQAEFAEKYLKKGYTIYVEGKLKTRNWEDQNNVKKYITEVVGDSITIISKNDKRDDASGAANAEVIEAPTGDDLPF